jgi:hypothetical protein
MFIQDFVKPSQIVENLKGDAYLQAQRKQTRYFDIADPVLSIEVRKKVKSYIKLLVRLKIEVA